MEEVDAVSAAVLAEGIILLSEAGVWDEARQEWCLDEIRREEEPQTCLCEHYPINEICTIRNERNNNTVEVGNVCVNKFMGLPSDKIFQALRRVAEDVSKALNAEAIRYAFDQDWINKWETEFYFNTWRKRKLTYKQQRKRQQINVLVLGQTGHRRP